jgi:hypothetical protein
MGPHYHSPVSPDGAPVVMHDISGHIVSGDLKSYHKQYLLAIFISDQRSLKGMWLIAWAIEW